MDKWFVIGRCYECGYETKTPHCDFSDGACPGCGEKPSWDKFTVTKGPNGLEYKKAPPPPRRVKNPVAVKVHKQSSAIRELLEVQSKIIEAIDDPKWDVSLISDAVLVTLTEPPKPKSVGWRERLSWGAWRKTN